MPLWGKSYFAVYISYVLTISYQLLGSNLSEGGELQDNAGAAIRMVGAALKASVHAEAKL